MDRPGQKTVSATQFATLTGVSRERLRTWERRHGFPDPVRHQAGPRRYALDDVGRVVAVRRAVDAGVPLTAAIAASTIDPEGGISAPAQAALAEHAPIAVAVLSGPQPLRLEYVNAAVRARPGAPPPGAELLELAPWFDREPGHRTLLRLFTTDAVAAACEHPDWMGDLQPGASSIAFRLPHEPGQRPLVGLIGMETGRERRTRELLDESERARQAIHIDAEGDRVFGEAAAAVADLFAAKSGAGAIAEAASVLVRRLGAVDAALAQNMTGALILARSARNLLGPEMVTVARFDDLSAVVHDGEITWLGDAASSAFGAPSSLDLLAVPVLAGAEALGALLILFGETADLSETRRRLLRVVATLFGLALVRERMAGELQEDPA